MKIAVYGCSFTYGARSNDYTSWADELLKLIPGVEIYNYSSAGTSLIFSLDIFEKTKHLYDYTIFQVTFPFRRTQIKLNAVDWTQLLKNNNNHYKFDKYEIDNFVETADKKDLLYLNDSEELLNHRIQIDYIKNNANFVFGQYRWDDRDSADIPYIQDMLSPKEIEDFKSDNIGAPYPGHFNQAGSRWIAEWIHKQIDLKKESCYIKKNMLIAGNSTYGISQGLKKLYPDAMYCSRTTGFDLKSPVDRQRFAELSVNHDVIILVSTLADFAQTMLLDKVYTVCKEHNPRAHIIVISSSTDRISKGMHWLYNTEKKSVRDLANSLGFIGDWESGPKVSRISFGAIKHKKHLHPDWNFIDIDSAAQYIKWIIDQPKEFNIFELGVEPMQNNEWWND